MKVQKKVSAQGEFAKPGEDIKDGDSITILDGGTETTGKFGDQIVYKVKTRNGDKNLGINQTSVNAFIDAFGDETDNWVGKVVGANLIKALVSGTMRNVVYLVPKGWILNEQGKVVKDTGDIADAGEKTIQLEEGEVDPKDIPF